MAVGFAYWADVQASQVIFRAAARKITCTKKKSTMLPQAKNAFHS